MLRYAPGQNPNGAQDDIAGVCNAERQRARPDAAPRARRRPADRLGRRRAAVRVARDGPRVSGSGTPPPAHRELGLTDAEYDGICERLGREPNALELAVFSLMWSEHCAYKHSKKLLRVLPTEGPHVLMGPGENAGAVDVGDGLAVAFKVESHNHPSAVEPFQGAATGVGGILRDIFAVGARPIAVLDSLRFGELDSARSRYLFDWAVKGIGHYGNSIGVPTVGGEVYFEPAYEQNCLVNAMCVGLARRERPDPERGRGRGQPARAARRAHRPRRHRRRVGAGQRRALRRGRLEAAERADRRSVRGVEADRVLPRAARARAAASRSRTSAPRACRRRSSEMASKGGVGLDIDVSRVPLREADMEPFEIMISESQERMLCVVEPERLAELLDVCERWDVRATRDRRGHRHAPPARVRRRRARRRHARGGARRRLPALRPRARASRPSRSTRSRRARLAADGVRRRDAARPARLAEHRLEALRLRAVRLDRRLAHRAPAWHGADAAVLMLAADGGSGALAVSIDGNGRRVACDPYTGTVEAVLECARNLACVGAEPLGLTNCLNFGNPEKPHIAWQLTRAGRGPARRLPRARGAGRGRERLALQRGRRRADLPDADRRNGRQAARPGAPRRGSASPRRATRSRSSARSPRRSTGSELEKLRGGLARRLPAVDLGEQAAALEAVREAVRAGRAGDRARRRARAGSLWRSPSAASTAASVPASSLAAVRRGRALRRGPGRRRVSGPREAVEALPGAPGDRRGRRRRARDRRRGDRVRVAAARGLRGRASPR